MTPGSDDICKQQPEPPLGPSGQITVNGRPVRKGWFWELNDRVARVAARCVDALYVHPVSRAMSRGLFRYTFCGCFNLAVGWLVYYLVFHFVVRDHFLDLGIVIMSPHIQSLFIQFPFTFGIGFWLNKYVAFDHSPLRGKTQLMRYLVTVGVAFGIKYALLKIFVEVFAVFPTISNILADLFNALASYLMQKYYTFRGRQAE